jgi:hypothetical protein
MDDLLRNLWALAKATPGYWISRFEKFAADVEERRQRGDFGKWPWQK